MQSTILFLQDGQWKMGVTNDGVTYNFIGGTEAEQRDAVELMGENMKDGVGALQDVLHNLLDLNGKTAETVVKETFGSTDKLLLEGRPISALYDPDDKSLLDIIDEVGKELVAALG